MNDLFGQEVKPRGKHYVRPRGYAGTPGLGKEGETCSSCKHHLKISRNKTYHKCNLINWTSGAATDIRVKSPACDRWDSKS